MKSVHLATITTALVISHLSSAEMITADAVQFAPGTDVSNAYEGVSLYTLTVLNVNSEPPEPLQLHYSPVYTADFHSNQSYLAAEGKRVFSPSSGESLYNPHFSDANRISDYLAYDETRGLSSIYSAALLADFDKATNFVQVVGGGGSRGNYFEMDVFDIVGAFLGTCMSGGYPSNNLLGCTATQVSHVSIDPGMGDEWALSFSSDISNIGFILAGGVTGGQTVESVAFSVPEPGALSLLVAGIVGLGIAQRRKKSGS